MHPTLTGGGGRQPQLSHSQQMLSNNTNMYRLNTPPVTYIHPRILASVSKLSTIDFPSGPASRRREWRVVLAITSLIAFTPPHRGRICSKILHSSRRERTREFKFPLDPTLCSTWFHHIRADSPQKEFLGMEMHRALPPEAECRRGEGIDHGKNRRKGRYQDGYSRLWWYGVLSPEGTASTGLSCAAAVLVLISIGSLHALLDFWPL